MTGATQPSREGGSDGVYLVALMVEHVRDDLLEGALPVAELHIAGRGHGVQLLVGEGGEQAEGVPRGRQPVEHVLSIESVDVSCHHSVDTWIEVGFGRSVEDPAVPGMLEQYTRVFEDAVRLMADCFELELEMLEEE